MIHSAAMATITKKIERGNGYSIWEIERNGKHMGFEVWKDRKATNPDGTKVIVRPSNEDFGTYGWYFPTRGPKMDAKIDSLGGGCRF